MDRRDYQASCAVCGGPADPDCASGCESSRLSMAIDQAETHWLDTWREKTREWVANHAIRYVTNTFQTMKEARLANHRAYVKALPYFAIYEHHQGQPPLHPQIVQELRRQIAQADAELRRNIDNDWRQCVVRYPEVLNYFFSKVNINLPKEVGLPAGLIPSVPAFMAPSKNAVAPIERARSTTGTTTGTKKTRRNSKSIPKGVEPDMSMETIAKILQGSHLANGGGISGNGMNGIHGMNIPSNMATDTPMIPSLQSVFANGGFPNIAAPPTMPTMSRTTSKAGRGSPVQQLHPPATRPSGKKRHSKDFANAGRQTAPPRHPAFAPPAMPQAGGWAARFA